MWEFNRAIWLDDNIEGKKQKTPEEQEISKKMSYEQSPLVKSTHPEKREEVEEDFKEKFHEQLVEEEIAKKIEIEKKIKEVIIKSKMKAKMEAKRKATYERYKKMRMGNPFDK